MALSAVLDRVPVDRITAEARKIRFWRTVLTLLAGLLFLIGWSVAKAFGVAWLVAAWTATAVKVGWLEGRKPHPVR